MIETFNMFMMQIFLLCLILIGLITVKARIVNEQARSAMSNLVLCVFLPCNILSSFFGTERSQLPSLGVILVISLGIMAFSFVLAQFVLYRKTAPEQKRVLLYATLISNASFLGNPVVESMYGLAGLTYAAAYLVPLRVAIWTFGIAVFTGKQGGLKKVLLHPCLIATFTGLLIMVTGFTPPVLVSRLAFSLGNCTTPVSMIIVGNILALVDPKKILTKLTVYFTFIRLIFIPAAVMVIMLIVRPDPMISGISVILSSMPAAVTTSMLADKYGADKELASKLIFLSTLLSVFTAPVLAWLLQMAL